MYDVLSHTVLFHKLNENEIESLLDIVGFKVRSVNAGDIIALSGDVLKGIYILIEGSVRAEMLDYSGKAITIENLQSPNLLAPAFLFGKSASLPVDIIAKGDVKLVFIAKPNLLKLMGLSETVLVNFLNVVSGKTQFLAEKINFLSFKTIREKYLYFLINTQKNIGKDNFVIRQTQSQLAEFFGVSRPALAKVISELNEEGVIRTKGKSVEILNVLDL